MSFEAGQRSERYRSVVPGHEPPVNPDSTEVAMSEWRMSEGGLYTRAVLDCIALAAVNAETGVSLLGHFNPGDFATARPFITAAVDAIADIGAPHATRVLLAGGMVSSGGTAHLERRESITAQLQRMATDNDIPRRVISTAWLEAEEWHTSGNRSGLGIWHAVDTSPERGEIAVVTQELLAGRQVRPLRTRVFGSAEIPQ